MEEKTNLKFNVLAIIAILIVCIAIAPITLQNDTFYTIKIGEFILENGITMMDPFSWHDNLPYTFPHWAYDVFIYSIYNIGGQVGIYMSTVILSCILGLSVYFVNTKLSKNNLTSLIITIGVMYFLKDFVAARAQLVTFILFILTMFCIERFLETKKKRYAIALIIIPIIIANVHLAVWPFYFVIYLPYIGEYLISILANSNVNLLKFRIKLLNKKLNSNKLSEEKSLKIKDKKENLDEKLNISIAKRKKKEEHPYKLIVKRNDTVLYLIIIMLICVFTGFLTPLGDTPFTYLLKTMQGNTTKNINEHLPMTLIDYKPFLTVLTVYLAILIFTDTKIKLKDLFMLGGLVILTLMSRRQISMCILLTSVILNNLVCDIFKKYDPNGCEKFKKFMVKFEGVIITICIALILAVYFVKPKMNDKFISESSYPVAASDYILENLDIKNIRLYNEYNYGSYLLFRGIPVFIDSRADLYAPEFNGGRNIFSDFINISSISTYYEDKFKEYKITHLIVYKNSKLNMFISRSPEDYKLLYNDDNFCIYERLVSND